MSNVDIGLTALSRNASHTAAEDLHNKMKKRRIEIFFRNRYISIGNNVRMKEKIDRFNDKQLGSFSTLKTVAGSSLTR